MSMGSRNTPDFLAVKKSTQGFFIPSLLAASASMSSARPMVSMNNDIPRKASRNQRQLSIDSPQRSSLV